MDEIRVSDLETAILTGVLVGDGSLVLFFSNESQVIVQCPFEVTSPHGVATGHGESPLTSTHLFGCLNKRVISAMMLAGWVLQISFENGYKVEILPEQNGLESYVMTVGGGIIPVIIE